jgi:hypothetical protein
MVDWSACPASRHALGLGPSFCVPQLRDHCDSHSRPEIDSTSLQSGIGESRWKHYFGWGCGGVHPCFDQAAITLLFYAAAAYSIGALLARKIPKHRHLASRREYWAFVITGFIFVLVSVLELVLTIQQGWKSMYLGLVMMPLGIGAFLILYAVMLHRRFVYSKLVPDESHRKVTIR